MGAGTTRIQPLLTSLEMCPYPRFTLSPLVKGSIRNLVTNRPLGRWLFGQVVALLLIQKHNVSYLLQDLHITQDSLISG